MVLKQRKFPLPKFPAGIDKQFLTLCAELSPDEIIQLRQELNAFVAHALQDLDSEADQDSLKDLYDRATLLLDLYPERSAKEKALIVGAVRYFAIANDLISEKIFCTGYNDDIKIMNHVLEELGLDSRWIELSS